MTTATVMSKLLLGWILALCVVSSVCIVDSLNGDGCHLWHIRKNGKCEHGSSLNGKIKFESDQLIKLANSLCMTWNNESQNAEVSYCLFISCRGDHGTTEYSIPTNISGIELNSMICKSYNRQGVQCRTCIDGYGPAVFSDGVTCTNCSKNRYLWILNLLFQLSSVAFTYLAVILLQVKGTACPLNITITYSQLTVNILMISSRLQNKLVCRFGQRLTTSILTILGVLNLDFFRFLIPKLCITSSTSPVNVLLLDYVIAISPLVLTVLAYICILLYDRNCRVIVFFSFPMKRCFQRHRNWNPKETILNTFATFLLCGYTKLLFISVNLLVGIHLYRSSGDPIPNSTVLLYDPTIRFFHSEHIPYVVLALSVIVIFVLLPPLLLMLYPTRLFRRCLKCIGFERWGVLHSVMDIFQGWYKDGTDGMYDYRPFSAFYMILRVGVGFTFIVIIFTDHDGTRVDYIFGILHIFFGTFFFTAKPYKKKWMNQVDGFLLTFTGAMLLMIDYHGNVYFIFAITGSSIVLIAYSYAVYKCLKLFV